MFFKKSDEDAFLQRLKRHSGIIIRVSRIYFDYEEDRKDLKQEIIYQLWKSFPSFRGESSFSTWMYRVAVNTALTYLQQQKKESIIHFYEKLPEIVEENDTDIKELQTKIFYDAIYKLTPVEKALIFYHLEGLPHKEIGEQLGISEVNARVKLNRIKEKTKEIIKKQGYEF
ncbi:sigma-70 family RNA polymerase sigma factor [Flavobacterium supellecticarium]|uniref:Sigma-70 family RNA polymerase sigma factor n=1 Tax=Flavobacterium supellecticarium TaxID=2565924 RepID=A0A4S4A3H9_9FLAO|nr:sigma-70 family RNA polymerase sigma factor [Flavobacterium supellecticarium]THF52984.1 sigma-70 family RNA polymerase sigma factor [Flavobacterium supellecticarium]